MEKRELIIWAARGPNGEIVRGSIGTFRAVAHRWAIRKRNYEVIKLGFVRAPIVTSATIASEPKAQNIAVPEIISAFEPPVKKRGRGRPRKHPVKNGNGGNATAA